jgi:predicted nucleic acid-binding protein
VTRFVLDASVALAWFFEDEYSTYAEFVAAEMTSNQAIVPVIWPLEITNALLTAAKRGRLPDVTVPGLLERVWQVGIEIDQGLTPFALADASAVLGLAHGLSSYDASYLELAVRRGLRLATEDNRLRQAASQSGVMVM